MNSIRHQQVLYEKLLERQLSALPTNVAKKVKIPMGMDFQPNSYTVLCGRGKGCIDWVGNRRFRVIIDMHLDAYASAKTKLEKSTTVARVYDIIDEAGGAFVKLEAGRWFKLGDVAAREKIGSHFRDCLSTQYRSSNKAKSSMRKLSTLQKQHQPLTLASEQTTAASVVDKSHVVSSDDDTCTMGSVYSCSSSHGSV